MDSSETVDLLSAMSDLLKRSETVIREYQKEVAVLTQENKDLAQSQETWNLISKNDSWFDFKEAAKLIGIKNFGRNKILELLRNVQILDENNQPYQRYVNQGLFKITVKHVEPIDLSFTVPLTSKKGIDFIVKTIKESEK